MRIQKIRDVKTPSRGTAGSAGLDFYVPNDQAALLLDHGDHARIPSGIKCRIPSGFALIAFNKSGVALRGLQVGACVVDSDYQGEISLHVRNISGFPVAILAGEKLIQLLLMPVVNCEVEVVDEALYEAVSERGGGGFGSTGAF